MDEIIHSTILGLMLTFVIGLIRVIRGPSRGDRLLSLQLTGTTSIAVLIALSNFGLYEGFINTAFALALLAPITTIAFLISAKNLSSNSGSDKNDVA